MKKEIIYTESAIKKLDVIVADFKQKIESDISKFKDYPGEDNIEITAADIENVYNRVRFVRRSGYKSNSIIKIIFPLYFIIGIFIMLFGLFYEEIQYLIHESPTRLAIVLSGFLLSLVSGALYYLMIQKEKERKENERKMNQERNEC